MSYQETNLFLYPSLGAADDRAPRWHVFTFWEPDLSHRYQRQDAIFGWNSQSKCQLSRIFVVLRIPEFAYPIRHGNIQANSKSRQRQKICWESWQWICWLGDHLLYFDGPELSGLWVARRGNDLRDCGMRDMKNSGI